MFLVQTWVTFSQVSPFGMKFQERSWIEGKIRWARLLSLPSKPGLQIHTAFSDLVKQVRVLTRSHTLVQESTVVSLLLQLVHEHSKPSMKSKHLETERFEMRPVKFWKI